jgi:hypothetical protein
MTKLNQIVAVVEGGLKQRTATKSTQIANALHRKELYNGFVRTYEPTDAEGETYPPERVLVQGNVEESLAYLGKTMSKLYDAVITRDIANMQATAEVVVDGEEILPALPVPFLLYLRNQLAELRPVLAKLPTLDPAEEWRLVDGVHRGAVVKTVKTQKIPEVLVRYPATDKHPAQTEVFTKDEIVGHWTGTKLSTALPAERKRALLARVDALASGVQVAIEQANDREIAQMKVGDALFGYLFEG